MKHPFYEIEIIANDCAVALVVNDMPCFVNYERGGMSVDWPVNPYILKDGNQTFNVKAIRYKGDSYINKSARLDLRVYVRDAFHNETPRVLLFEMPTIDFSKKEKESQSYIYGCLFKAEVPYKLIGWEDSLSLFDEDKDLIIKEIEQKYEELYQIFKNKDIASYKRITQDRYQDLCTAYYISEEMKVSRESSMMPSFEGDFTKVDFKKYKFEFYGLGNVAGVYLPYEPCGFQFESTGEDGQLITELALFHRRKKGDPLTFIR